MEFKKIIIEKENPLFSRKEIVVEVKSESNPNRLDVEKFLTEKFPNQDSMKVDRIVPRFGSNIFTIHARVYKSKKDRDEIEPAQKTGGKKTEKTAPAKGAK